jgi:hypothetical protein
VLLADPQFVGSFDVGEYVYFIFREHAIEHAGCGKQVYSRVARVCKVSKFTGRSLMVLANATSTQTINKTLFYENIKLKFVLCDSP